MIKMTNEEKLLEHLAKALWASFDYGSPIPPGELARFIMKQIDIAGFKIIRGE